MNSELLTLIERLKLKKESLRAQYSYNEYIAVQYNTSADVYDVTIEGVDFFDHPEHRHHQYSEKQFLQFLIDNADLLGAWR